MGLVGAGKDRLKSKRVSKRKLRRKLHNVKLLKINGKICMLTGQIYE